MKDAVIEFNDHEIIPHKRFLVKDFAPPRKVMETGALGSWCFSSTASYSGGMDMGFVHYHYVGCDYISSGTGFVSITAFGAHTGGEHFTPLHMQKNKTKYVPRY
jgi:hypothetical protein